MKVSYLFISHFGMYTFFLGIVAFSVLCILCACKSLFAALSRPLELFVYVLETYYAKDQTTHPIAVLSVQVLSVPTSVHG